jgi:integrase
MRKTLTDRGVLALKPRRGQRYAEPDAELAGHYVRVQPSGAKSYCAVSRNPAGRQIWTTIGSTETMPIGEARIRAREIMRRVRDGLPATEPKGETFGAVAQTWLVRHVEKNELRSAGEIKRLLDKYVLPAWSDLQFVSIRRSDVTALLDYIEDHHGARTADYCLAVIRKMMNWAATRRDDYTPPIVRGMRRQSLSAQARDRILSDQEIKAVWEAADNAGPFGALVQIAILTGQRREKLSSMRWDDVKDGVWSIPAAPREKQTAGVLVLPDMVRQIIESQPRLASNPFIFAGRVDGPINGFSKMKARLDRLSGVSGWVVHDCRRTARSLMSRAGVPARDSERVLGHALVGVEGTYDRHGYDDEKADALRRLAALINSIVSPRSADVLPMQRRRK